MKARQWIQTAAVTMAVGFAGAAFAADTGSMGMGHDATTSPLGKTPATAGTGGNDQSMRLPLGVWMNDYAAKHNGRITREEFMDQMGTRWDMYDREHRGYMTPDEAREIYGTDEGETSGMAPARSGAQVTPGYMGPGNARGK